jgi:transposase-like protein
VEELLCERGITVTHEAIRQWCRKFGQDYANQLKHRRGFCRKFSFGTVCGMISLHDHR